jgi:hypothetical protein
MEDDDKSQESVDCDRRNATEERSACCHFRFCWERRSGEMTLGDSPETHHLWYIFS